MTDLTELKKLALASTPVGEVVRYEHGGGRMFNGTDLIADTFEEADREFYAVARQECLYLIARLERAENLARDMLDPERFGWAVTGDVRDAARAVLGEAPCEALKERR